MQVGTPNFNAYNRTLRRILWADFIDEQLRVARESSYRASLVEDTCSAPASILKCIESSRSDRRE